jgi:thiol-disulfide isomerase/thioredoxin
MTVFMKAMQILFRRILVSVNIALLAAAAMALCGQVRAATTNAPGAANAEADTAWKEVQKALVAPTPPAEWQAQKPPPEQVESFRAEQGRLAGVAADKLKDFFTRFPDDAKAEQARQRHFEMLQVAVRLGNTNKLAELEERLQARASDPKASEDERVQLRVEAVQRAAMARKEQGMTAVLADYEKGARELLKEFPKRDEPYQMLLTVAGDSDAKTARALVQEVLAGTDTASLKAEAKDLLETLDMLGKPLAIKFTALDGRAVDLGKLSGKVVLVDFWATWCGPCVAELPNVKAAYDKLHAKGFEIVGISFDDDKGKLQRFVAKEETKWPQYFDGKGWENKFGQQFGIHSIPAMWLVDKMGNLRDTNGRDALAGKVEKLLAE